MADSEPPARPTVAVFVGDLLKAPCEVICTSTNPHLALMAGTGGAARLFGGQQIQDECDRHIDEAFVATGKRYLPTGAARLTGGGQLPFAAIIHCVAIDAFHGSSQEVIAGCVREALGIAQDRGFPTLAMPVFATGNGRFPYAIALEAMGRELATHAGSVRRVWIVVTSSDQADEVRRLLEPVVGPLEVRVQEDCASDSIA